MQKIYIFALINKSYWSL